MPILGNTGWASSSQLSRAGRKFNQFLGEITNGRRLVFFFKPTVLPQKIWLKIPICFISVSQVTEPPAPPPPPSPQPSIAPKFILATTHDCLCESSNSYLTA